MSRLLIQRGQGGTHEFVLKPGANRLGRNEQNDHQIDDPTVSGFHCEIDFNNGVLVVQDLGSTNGTFINSVPVRQAILEPGQTLMLGSVEILLPTDIPPIAPPAAPAIPKIGIRIARTQSEPPPLPPPVAPVGAPPPPPAQPGSDSCRNHPGVQAALICQQCGTLFCKKCVRTVHAGARDVHSCLGCGGMCVKVADYRKAVARKNATFGSLLPTAFKYPLQQNGPIILLCGTILFTLLDLARFVLLKAGMMIGFPLLLTIVMSFGFLFAYMQNIIIATTNGDDNPPGWPEISGFWDDVGLPALRWIAIWAVCTAPGIATMILVSLPVGIVVLLLGLFCVPMCFLTVCVSDSLGGLNPLIIFSSIIKVPGPYLIACLVFLVVSGLETICEKMMALSPLFIVSALVAKFVSLYGLTVEMRILGLLYLMNKEKLSWFD